MEADFVARAPFDREHPRLLAIYCSDGRFTTAVEELAETRGHGAVDTLTHPGGPALFSYSARYSDRDAMRGAADFLIRKHGIRTVVLVAHENCGYYADRHPRLTAEAREKLQLDDLVGAARAIGELAPRVAVEAYFARVRGGRVAFDAVSIARDRAGTARRG